MVQYIKGNSQHGYDATFTGPDGKPIGPRAQSSWLYDVPWGFYNLLKYIQGR